MFKRIVTAAALSACLAVPAAAQSFNQFVGFGMSEVDSGWFKNASTGNGTVNTLIANAVALGANGAPVGGGNLVSAQILASYFGLAAIPANQPGGTNYAVSGALDAAVAGNGFSSNLQPNPDLPSVVQQISNYLAAYGGVANPNGLYLLSSGGDVIYADKNIVGVAAQQALLTSQAGLVASTIQTLQATGARYIIVRNLPDLGFANEQFYTQLLWSQLNADGVKFIPSDIWSIVKVVQANPTAFGFTAGTVLPGVVGAGTGSACVTPLGSPASATSWAEYCINSTVPSASYSYLRAANSQQTSLFSDDQHFSAAGNKIVADYEYSLLVAPSQISFLAEAPVKARATAVASIQNQIEISASDKSAAEYHGWAAGDVTSLKANNNSAGFPSDPGTPVFLTAGFDFKKADGWLFGAAFTAAYTKQTYSLGGDFKQSEGAVSLYAARAADHFWFSLIGTYGALRYNVNRIVPIGITSVTNTGSSNGGNLSLSGEAGYKFINGPLTHGPVAGLTWQRVKVDGFTETDSFGGLTALSYGDQIRNSAVTELGYQIFYDIGKWRPFAKLAWDHELVSSDRSVTASLTTTVAPSYSMPAVTFGSDWGMATVGTTLNLGSGVTAVATVTAQAAQKNVTTYSEQFGVSVAF